MRHLWVFLLILPATSRADQFESIEGKALVAAMKGADAKAVERLTLNDLGALPNVLKDARSTLLAVKTTKGNVTRLLVTPELRKPEGGGAPMPVFLLERFDTFDNEDLSARLAKGREMVLFPGFQVDLDTGQVVPEGRGGDLSYVVDKDIPTLVVLKGAKLYTLNRVPAPDPTKPPQPTPGRAVVPRDFAERYRLFANGQWSGTLDLAVDPKGEVSGQFRSDTHGAAYPVTGQVAVDVPNKVALIVKFPRSRGEFDGYLWTEGKGALAGTFHLNDRTFGFFAVRDGGKFAPEGAEVGGMATDTRERLLIEVKGDQFVFEGKEYAPDGLTELLHSRRVGDNPPVVTIRAPSDARFESVRRGVEAAEAAGIRSIRLAPIGEPSAIKP